MIFIPENIPHIPRIKNTNMEARRLKEDVFRVITSGPMQGQIICNKMAARCDILGYECVESASRILKRYLTLLGFGNVEYKKKEDKYGTIFTIRFYYDKEKIKTYGAQYGAILKKDF